MFANPKRKYCDLVSMYITAFLHYTWRISFFVFAWISWSYGMHFWSDLSLSDWGFHIRTVIEAALISSVLYVIIAVLYSFKKNPDPKFS